MAAIPVSHVTEDDSEILFPWIVRCHRCGWEVARLDQAELTALVMDEHVEPILCFDCETLNDAHGYPPLAHSYRERAPWPTLSVPSRLLGLV